jgi:SAM domain (Sterile alpha motif)
MTSAAAWLEELGLAQYAEIFAQQAIDFEVISDLTEMDLEALGIPLGHRKWMLKAIDALAGAARAAHTAKLTLPSVIRREMPAHRAVLRYRRLNGTGVRARCDPRFQETCGVVVRQAGSYIAKYMGDVQ